jgi:hypothetical protein
MRTRFELPREIRVAAQTCSVWCNATGAEYWLPPNVAGRLLASGKSLVELHIGSRDEIPAAVAAICG